MAGLTARAQALMHGAKRHPTERNRARIVALSQAEGLPIFEPVVAFQECYGGIELGSLLLGYIKDDAVYGFDGEDGHYYFYCAEDMASAPVNFFIDEAGVFYVGTYPVAERFETYVEWCALVTEMTRQQGWHQTTIGYVWRDDQRLEALIEAPPIAEASDTYLRCWGDDRARICRIADLYDQDYRDDVVVYARRRSDLRPLQARLESGVQHEPKRSVWREFLDVLRLPR